MEFEGEFTIPLPKEKVFELLASPEKFAPLIPSFQSLEKIDERTAIVRVKAGIGRIRGTASTELMLEKSRPPHEARYAGKGTIMQGAYRISSSFDLRDADGGTLVKWRGAVQLMGKILSLVGGGMRRYAEMEITRLINSLQLALSPAAERTRMAEPVEHGQPARVLPPTAGKPTPDPSSTSAQQEASLSARAPELSKQQQQTKDRIEKILQMKGAGGRTARKEDNRLLRGRGLFVDDYQPAGTLHMVLVRSPYAHARILRVDVSRAEALPGVVCTLTGKEIAKLCVPFMQIGPEPGASIQDYPLAVEKVLYQGDPVAAVVAESRHIAADAAQLVRVDYESLPAVIECEDALKDEVILHEQAGTNTVWRGLYEYGDVDKAFSEAAHILKIDKLHFHRFSSTPLETNAVVATWDRLDNIEFQSNNHMTVCMTMIAAALQISIDRIRLKTHDIGGSFGNKVNNYPYMMLAALASRKAGGVPVKWIETRSENMQAGGQGSSRSFFDTEVALDQNGVVTALRSRHVDDIGAYPRYEPLGSVIWAQVIPASYRLRNICIDFTQITTNKGPCSPNRGYSRLPYTWFMERVVDICGHQLGIPAVEMRLRNYIPEFPYTAPNGCVYDSGDLPKMLETAKQLIGWDDWKKRQEQARAEGRLIGLGIGNTVESGTNNFGQSRIINPYLPFSGNIQVSNVKLDLDGSVVATLATIPQGQSHETITSQLIAEELGIDPGMVNVHVGFDSARNCHSGVSGTYASQFVVTSLSATHGAVTRLKEEMRKLAAFALEANIDDLEFGLGEQGPEVRVIGTDRGINYWALSNMVNANNSGLPEELKNLTLNIRNTFSPPFENPDNEKKYGNLTLTYALQLHIAVVEVDRETCRTKILDYAIVDDCGTVMNHMTLEGQTHGGAAHGIGAALLETMPFDKDGNLLSGSFTDYAPITIQNMPELRYATIETPSPFTFNGAKGAGEAGGTPVVAISAALQDALFDEGVIICSSHNSPMALYDAIKGDRPKPEVVLDP